VTSAEGLRAVTRLITNKAAIKQTADFRCDVAKDLQEHDEGAMLWPHFWQL